jgi:hypothetical protein
MVIDLEGLSAKEVQVNFPEVYQHVKIEVKEKIKINKKGEVEKIGRDWNNEDYRRINWWVFGRKHTLLRDFLKNKDRYIATVETTKHRIFQFLDHSILPDHKILAIGSDDAFHFGVLSSHIHWYWYIANSAKIGMYEGDAVYVKSRCFDPFPFPDATDTQKSAIRAIAEELDAHRKRVLAAHPHLTLTGLYNVLEKLKAGNTPAALAADDRRIFDDGLVLILQEHHAALDAAVSDAYGWPVDLPEEEILARLVALNHARAKEEAAGNVKWLRPDFQIPRFGSSKDKAELELVGGEGGGMVETIAAAQKPAFPADDYGQMAAVMAAMASAGGTPDAVTIAATFRQGQRIQPRVMATLNALARTGWISSSDGGRTFAMRRVA